LVENGLPAFYTRLMQVCPSCAEENPPRFRLCGFCGAALTAAPPPQEVRKRVTILFCDLKGSTSLGETLDSESLREVMSRYFEVMSAAIGRHEGTIEKFIGDAVMAVFGIPRVREDDALRAVRAVREMQEGLLLLNDELERAYGVRLANRIGVNTGEVVASSGVVAGQRMLIGDPVNVAARLEQSAGEMEALIGGLTYRLVRDYVRVEQVEPLELKGKAERIPAYRLVEVLAHRAQPAGQDRFVGREQEVAALEGALDRVVAGRSCEIFVVTGEAGVGKSRLLHELTSRASNRALVIRGHCLSYGSGVTFWPIVEAVREAAGITEEDDLAAAQQKLLEAVDGDAKVAERIGSAVGLSDHQYPLHEIYWGARKLVEILARNRPLVIVLEDLHWAEPVLFDLIDAVVSSVSDAPALIVAAGRPDLLERREAWATEPRIALGALSDADAGLMIDHVLGNAPLAPDARRRIVDAAEGNPLFVEQLVSMMIDEGLLRQVDGTWEVDELPVGWVPPTIHALLSARLDHLGHEERAVIDPASVIGFHFPSDALNELVEDYVRDGLDNRLCDLQRKQFVRREEADDMYRFDHVLIRESVYEALLKRARASLHERFVGWADRVNGDRAVEFEEILGYHLEQAYRYLVELAPGDEHALEVGRDGGRRLASAGRRAFERGDMHAASRLLLRATALLPPLDPERLQQFPDLGEALMQIGEVAQAESLLEDAVATAELAGAAAIAAKIEVVRVLIRRLSGEEANWNEEAMAVATEAIAVCEREGDDAGLARAWRMVASVHGNACRFGSAAEALQRALEHARRAEDVRQERRSSSPYALVMAYGPTPVADAIARCDEIAGRVAGDRQAEAALLCSLGHLHALAGEFEAARGLMRTSRALFEELELQVDAATMSMQASHVEFLAGDAAGAEAELRRGYEVLDRLGDRYFLPTIAGLLAQALLLQGRSSEAAELTDIAEERARCDDVDAQALWRSVRAKMLARSGEQEAAEELALEALELLAPTDAVLFQVAALFDLAEVQQIGGQFTEAATTADAALALAEAKQSPVLVSRLQALKEAAAVARLPGVELTTAQSKP
jgi:predicted ATPase/class 3 adenylate cyclase